MLDFSLHPVPLPLCLTSFDRCRSLINMLDSKFCASEEPNLQVPVLRSWFMWGEGIKDTLKMAAEIPGEGEPARPAEGRWAGAGLQGASSGMKSDGRWGCLGEGVLCRLRHRHRPWVAGAEKRLV